MTTIAQLYEATKQLLDHLSHSFPKEHREDYIDRLESLLQSRQQLIEAYRSDSSGVDQEKTEAIVNWNKEINKKLNLYLGQIKLDMNKLKQQKKMGMKYDNPYNAQPDGFFFDKKN